MKHVEWTPTGKVERDMTQAEMDDLLVKQAASRDIIEASKKNDPLVLIQSLVDQLEEKGIAVDLTKGEIK